MIRAALILLCLLPAFARAAEPAITDPRGVSLVLPGASAVDGRLSMLPDAVDAVVRTQTPEYLQKVVASMLPRPQDFVVGRIEGGPGPAIPAYIAGRVVETAAKVEFRVDGAGPYFAASTLRATRPGYPKVWTWVIPEALQDGKPHKVYARALRSSGTVIGPLDNAKSAAQWIFTIGAMPPPPPPVPPVVTKCARVLAHDATARSVSGIITATATHVEPRIGNNNLGLIAATAGKWTASLVGLAPGTYAITGQALRRSGDAGTGPWEVVCSFDEPFTFTVAAPVNG